MEKILWEFCKKLLFCKQTLFFVLLCSLKYNLFFFFTSDLFTVIISGEGLATFEIHGMCSIVLN